jgi:hypothetical protein
MKFPMLALFWMGLVTAAHAGEELIDCHVHPGPCCGPKV